MSYFAVVLAPSIRASFKLRNISLLQLSKINKNSCLKSLQLFSVIEYLMKFPELCSTENYAVKNPSIDSDLSQLSLCFSSNLFQTNKYKLSSALPLNKTSVLWLSKFIQQKHIIVGDEPFFNNNKNNAVLIFEKMGRRRKKFKHAN